MSFQACDSYSNNRNPVVRRIQSSSNFITTTPNFINHLPEASEEERTIAILNRAKSAFELIKQGGIADSKITSTDPNLSPQKDSEGIVIQNSVPTNGIDLNNGDDADDSNTSHAQNQLGVMSDAKSQFSEKSILWNKLNDLDNSNIADRSNAKLLDESFGSKKELPSHRETVI